MYSVNSHNSFCTIGKLYDFILANFQKTGRNLPIPAAIMQMREAGLLMLDRPEIPPFVSGIDAEGFVQFVRQMPVDAGQIIASLPAETPDREADIFPPEKDVFCFMHMPYTGQAKHAHDYFEITYVPQGTCTYYFEDERVTLNEGDLVIASLHAMHEVSPEEDAMAAAITIRRSTFQAVFGQFLSRPDLISLFFRKCLQEQSGPNFILLHTGNTQELLRTVHELFYESYLRDQYANDSTISLMALLLTRALRASAANMTIHRYEGYTRHDFEFSAILHFIQQNYRTLTLASLAKTFHFSEAYLSKLIHQNMNLSFTEVIRTLRMHDAAELLLHTELRISEIAETEGYSSVDHFTRTFRSFFGLTPRDYRKAAQNPDVEEALKRPAHYDPATLVSEDEMDRNRNISQQAYDGLGEVEFEQVSSIENRK